MHVGRSLKQRRPEASPRQTKSNNRISALSRALLQLRQQRRFQIVRISLQLARRSHLVRRSLETKFANSQAILRPNRRTKHPARHRPRFVEFTVPRLRIERRTRLIIRKLLKPPRAFLRLVQYSACRIARKLRRQSSHRVPGPFPHSSCALRRPLLQIVQSALQPPTIELIDRKRPNTTLRAPRPANQPLPAQASHVGQRRVHNLNEFSILRSREPSPHIPRIVAASQLRQYL